MKHCNNCGFISKDNANFCNKCGTELIIYTANNKLKKFLLISLKIFIISNILLYVSGFISGVLNSVIPTYSINQKNRIIDEINGKEIYKNNYWGIYVYLIPKEKFNLKKFVNYSQKLPKGNGQSTFSFAFNHKINIAQLTKANKTIPFYQLDILWKEKPYFYFSNAYDTQEYFCKIFPKRQEYYHRNMVKGEKLFNHITTYAYEDLNALTGCSYDNSIKSIRQKDEVNKAKKYLEENLSKNTSYSEAEQWLNKVKAYRLAEYNFNHNIASTELYKKLTKTTNDYFSYEESLKTGEYKYIEPYDFEGGLQRDFEYQE